MSTAITVQDLGREKIELIKQTVAKGATDLELELFLHACKHTGLDPLMKQLYCIKRWSAAEGREVMSFQTGIDGLRLIADRTGQYAGSDEPVFMLGEDGFPDVASVTVHKFVGGVKCAFTHSVRWKEYVQLKKDGTPTSFWVKMPFGQLGKCAESGALRKAFPMELSGVYSNDEMMQADSPENKPYRKATEMLRELEQGHTPGENGQGDGLENTDGAPASSSGFRAPVNQDAPALPKAAHRGIVEPGATVATVQASPHQGDGTIKRLIVDDPAESYRVKLRVCERTPQAITHTYNAIPEELRQDVFTEYQAQLKSLAKKK